MNKKPIILSSIYLVILIVLQRWFLIWPDSSKYLTFQYGLTPLLALTNLILPTRTIPLIFSTLFMLFILYWAEEVKENLSIYVFGLLMVSYTFLILSPAFLQEVPLLLFVTIALYFLKEYIEEQTNKNIIIMCLFLLLASLTKETGLIISAVIFIFLFLKYDKKQVFTTYLIFFLPIIAMSLINLIIYNNIFFSGVTKSWFIIEGYEITFLSFLRQISSKFIPFLLALFYMVKNIKKTYIQIILTCIIVFLVMIELNTLRFLVRYFYPLFGILTIFAALEVKYIIKKLK